MCDQHMLSPASTNVSSSSVDVVDEIGENLPQNGAKSVFGGGYLMCSPAGDSTRSETDSPAAVVPDAGESPMGSGM
jgi:hypothetical protein